MGRPPEPQPLVVGTAPPFTVGDADDVTIKDTVDAHGGWGGYVCSSLESPGRSPNSSFTNTPNSRSKSGPYTDDLISWTSNCGPAQPSPVFRLVVIRQAHTGNEVIGNRPQACTSMVIASEVAGNGSYRSIVGFRGMMLDIT